MSPASIAALVGLAAAPAAQARLAEALTDERANVRAVAARVIYVTASRGHVPRARAALTKESEPEVANELIRLAVAYGGPEGLEDAWSAAARLNAYALPALAEALAAYNRPALLSNLQRLMESGIAPSALASFALEATSTEPAKRLEALKVFATTEEGLSAALGQLGLRKEPVPPELLSAWLGSDLAMQRSHALWSVLSTQDTLPKDSDELSPIRPTLNALVAARNVKDVTWDALAVELLARATGQRAQTRTWMALKTVDAGKRPAPGPSSPLYEKYLKDEEQDDVREVLTGSRERPTDSRIGERGREVLKSGDVALRPMRTVPPFAGDLWRELAAMHGCALSDTQVILATVAYKGGGRPGHISLMSGVPAPCASVAVTLFSLSLSTSWPSAATPPADEVLILPLTQAMTACTAEPASWARSGLGRVGGQLDGQRIQAPSKVRNVNPVYPDHDLRGGEQGIAMMDATLTSTGCVREITLRKSAPTATLDLAAMLAVAQWKYAPATLGGKAVPVLITVTVNFLLR